MIRNINTLTMPAAGAAVAVTAFGPGVAQAYPDRPMELRKRPIAILREP